MNFEVVARRERECGANRRGLGDGDVGVQEFDAGDLRETARDETRTVAVDVAGRVLFCVEDPSAADDVSTLRRSLESPRLVLVQRDHLFLHRLPPA